MWIANRSKNDTAKLIMTFWCLSDFIESGYEHSIANQSLMSFALFSPHGAEFSVAGFTHNQIFITAGYILGAGLIVGMVYTFIQSPLTFKSQINDWSRYHRRNDEGTHSLKSSGYFLQSVQS